MNVVFSMKKNEFILDKFSVPQNHPLFIAMQVFSCNENEIHINDLIERVLRLRKNSENLNDEVRIIKAVALLIGLGKIGYYKGFVYKT